MSKIAVEMYKSVLRELIWQMSDDLGPAAASRLAFEILQEHSNELAAFAAEQGVTLQKPDDVA